MARKAIEGEIASCGFSSLQSIGEGSYSKVYSARNQEGRAVAVKYFLDGGVQDPIELDILFRLLHANLSRGLRLLTPEDCQVQNLAVSLPLAKVSGADILELWQYDVSARISIIHQLLCGLDFLHAQGILHLDIKPPNILISGTPYQPEAQLSDFGLAAYLTGDVFLSSDEKITPTYRAPEYFDDLKNPHHVPGSTYTYRKSADIWSLGITSLELITGSIVMRELGDISPFLSLLSDPQEKEEILDQAVQGLPEAKDLKDLLSRMLEWNEKSRITASEALMHPLFSQLPRCQQGSTIEARTPYNFTPENAEENILLLLSMVGESEIYRSFRVEVLFLTVDLVYRCVDLPAMLSEPREVILAILWLSMNLLSLIDMGGREAYQELVGNRSVRDAWARTQTLQVSIVRHLQGILYRKYIYAAAKDLGQLEAAWESYVRYPQLYFDLDPRSISSLESTVPIDKTKVTVGVFLGANAT